MATVRSLEVKERTHLGTGGARAIRREGFVPVSLYGNNIAPATLSIEEKLLVKEMHKEGFLSHIFEINVGSEKQQILVRQYQLHPVTDRPLHVDFLRVSQSSRITVEVPFHFINEDLCPGIKMGGNMNVPRHTLPLICSPMAIPEHIEVNLESLNIGDSVTLSQITLPQGVEVFHREKFETILTIAAQKSEEELEGSDPVAATPEATSSK